MAAGASTNGKGKGKGKQAEKPKPEIYLQFMGSKLLVHEDEDGVGSVKEEDVEHVKGATLKFEGWEGEVLYKGLKVRFAVLTNSQKSLERDSRNR